jgi:nucleotide-binding universal stress UspA family protein
MKTNSPKRKRRPHIKPERILVPVDFSDSSARAVHYAAEQAAKSSGSLILVHVVPADYGWSRIGQDESQELDRSLQRQAADRLRAFADEHLGHNVAADFEVRMGRPAEEIVAAAGELNCDSIVISTRGLTGLDRYLIGSVADRVARTAPCPVVLIRPAKYAAGPKESTFFVLRFKREAKQDRKPK